MKPEDGTVARLLAVILLVLSMAVVAGGRDQPKNSQPLIGAPKNVEFAGGDGNSCDGAIVPRGSKGTRDSVASELAWLQAHYPG